MKPVATASALVFLTAMSGAASAQGAPAPAAPAAATAGYNVASTTIGVLLDDPAAKAILDKHAPQVSVHPDIDQARQMTLKEAQPYAPDILSDAVLARIQGDLSKLPAK